MNNAISVALSIINADLIMSMDNCTELTFEVIPKVLGLHISKDVKGVRQITSIMGNSDYSTNYFKFNKELEAQMDNRCMISYTDTRELLTTIGECMSYIINKNLSKVESITELSIMNNFIIWDCHISNEDPLSISISYGDINLLFAIFDES